MLNSLAITSLASNKEVVDTIFVNGERTISKLVSELIDIRFDDAKLDKLSKQITKEFEILLKHDGSFDYLFDSIFPVAKVISDDKLVRIFTWFAIRADGTHVHFGFIQYFSKSKGEVLLFPLIDNSGIIEDSENQSLSSNNWYGSTYYDIVQSKSIYGQLYVLLGWDGNDIYTKKKIVESLLFSEDNKVKFGIPIFVLNRLKSKRLIFEYSRMASMMLKYDKSHEMIVMDHLAPSKPVYNGNRQFYGPDLSFDALKFEDGYWVYYPTIDYKPIENKRRSKR